MSALPPLDHEEIIRRIGRDLADSYDEELEMEIEDRHPLPGDRRTARTATPKGTTAASYFRELFRLQAELVKLQDWVVATRQKVVILFEGRDAAGKGGAIKRITQRLNPRVCRVVALPAPSDRERTQWYFQRYVPHLPAAGEIVLFDRSWYNRAGVERVMGFCTPDEYEEFFRSVPEFERMLVRSGIRLIKYWFSITDEEQHLRFLGPHPRSAEAMEAEPDGSRVAPALGGLHQGEGSHARAHRTSRRRRWWVVQAVDKKRARLNCIDHLLKQFPYERGAEAAGRAAGARAARALLAPGRAGGDAGSRAVLVGDPVKCCPARSSCTGHGSSAPSRPGASFRFSPLARNCIPG